MSFSCSKKWALNKEKHINSRRVAVRSCIVCCLGYGNLTYTEMVSYYTKNNNLNNDNLDDINIEEIINELTDLRQKSIELDNINLENRKKFKKLGFRSISKKEKEFKNKINSQIFELWKNYKERDLK